MCFQGALRDSAVVCYRWGALLSDEPCSRQKQDGVRRSFLSENSLICQPWLSKAAVDTSVRCYGGSNQADRSERGEGTAWARFQTSGEWADKRVSLTLPNPSARWNGFAAEVFLKPPEDLVHLFPPASLLPLVIHRVNKQSSAYLSWTLQATRYQNLTLSPCHFTGL